MEKIKRYSEAFKRQVVSEYQAGNSISDLQKKYGVTGGQTVQSWIKKYASAGLRHNVVHIQNAEEANLVKELEDQVRELEQTLGKVLTEKLKLEAILEELTETTEELVEKNGAPSSAGWPSKRRHKR